MSRNWFFKTPTTLICFHACDCEIWVFIHYYKLLNQSKNNIFIKKNLLVKFEVANRSVISRSIFFALLKNFKSSLYFMYHTSGKSFVNNHILQALIDAFAWKIQLQKIISWTCDINNLFYVDIAGSFFFHFNYLVLNGKVYFILFWFNCFEKIYFSIKWRVFFRLEGSFWYIDDYLTSTVLQKSQVYQSSFNNIF